MNLDASDGTTKSEPTNADTEATQRNKNDRGRSGQATPVDEGVSNVEYDSHSHKCTERAHRTGLRTAANHASWREVYRACHVGVGVDE